MNSVNWTVLDIDSESYLKQIKLQKISLDETTLHSSVRGCP